MEKIHSAIIKFLVKTLGTIINPCIILEIYAFFVNAIKVLLIGAIAFLTIWKLFDLVGG